MVKKNKRIIIAVIIASLLIISTIVVIALVPSEPQTFIGVRDKICESPAKTYDDITLNNGLEDATINYVTEIYNQVRGKENWFFTSFTQIDQSIPVIGIKAKRKPSTDPMFNSAGFLMHSDTKVLLVPPVEMVCNDLISSSILETKKLGRSDIFYSKTYKVYLVCSANERFLWSFKSKRDARTFERYNEVC